MSNKQLGASIVVALVLIGVGALAFTSRGDTTMNDSMASHSPSGNQSMEMGSGMTMETNQVSFKGFAVVQKSIKVKKGTTVTWTNEDGAKHDVTPDTESADFKASELFGKGETYSVTFNTAGTYSYYCSPHPYMKGTVEVVE